MNEMKIIYESMLLMIYISLYILFNSNMMTINVMKLLIISMFQISICSKNYFFLLPLALNVIFSIHIIAHWTRKSYTNVKTQMEAVGVSAVTLTAMDSGFMFTYAGGSFITGQLGDRFSPVVVIAMGLLGSTFCLFAMIMGTTEWIVTSATMCGIW